jgi:hypothetical protein
MVRAAGLRLPPRRDTPLRHTRSPGYSGSLLRGALAIATAELFTGKVSLPFRVHQRDG